MQNRASCRLIQSDYMQTNGRGKAAPVPVVEAAPYLISVMKLLASTEPQPVG